MHIFFLRLLAFAWLHFIENKVLSLVECREIFFIINQAFISESQLLMMISLLRVDKIGLYYILWVCWLFHLSISQRPVRKIYFKIMRLDEAYFPTFKPKDLSNCFIHLNSTWDTLACCPYFIYQEDNKDLM